VIKEKNFHEQHKKEYLKETDKPWTTYDEEKTEEPEN
jgi:hypothetical protein